MTLDEYKKQHGLTYQRLAELLEISGNSGARTVQRYAEGSRFPAPVMLDKIRTMTDGAVTPNDFVDQHAKIHPSTNEKAA
ncbi:helix-turn-helix domain-containing protein [Komagataeibacter oboediens]|uniref:helix-turn-helix domain-containing protein n=1 Tax=Komagataeibacter oboediens TaxID=65958 RepID=UPI0012F4CF9B|nr:helix-turn-helix transcriptional regulator [Komagataeibacter oboediens]